MIKVFECLGVQTFEKDGKKGINIYYSEPFDEFEKNFSGYVVVPKDALK